MVWNTGLCLARWGQPPPPGCVPSWSLVKINPVLAKPRTGGWCRLFSVVPSNRTRGNRYRLKHKKIHLNMRKNFFTLRVREHGNRLRGGVVESPYLEVFTTHLDEVLCSLL